MPAHGKLALVAIVSFQPHQSAWCSEDAVQFACCGMAGGAVLTMLGSAPTPSSRSSCRNDTSAYTHRMAAQQSIPCIPLHGIGQVLAYALAHAQASARKGGLHLMLIRRGNVSPRALSGGRNN